MKIVPVQYCTSTCIGKSSASFSVLPTELVFVSELQSEGDWRVLGLKEAVNSSFPVLRLRVGEIDLVSPVVLI